MAEGKEITGTGYQVKPYEELTDDEKIRRYKARIAWFDTEYNNWRNEADKNISYYRLKNSVYTKGGQKVRTPMVIKNVDAMVAALTAFEVVPVVAPKGQTTYNIARVQQEALRNEWDELDVIEQCEYAIKEGVVTGFGVVKVGYEYQEEGEEVVEKGLVLDEESGEQTVGVDTDDSDVVVLKDTVYVEHIPFDEIGWDPEAKKWDDCTFAYHRYTMTLEELKLDPSFKNTENLKGNTSINDKWKAASTGPKTDMTDEERVTVYEFWDLVRGTICWFAEGYDLILREAPSPFAKRSTLKKRNPFVPYITRSDIGRVPGISDVYVMRPMQDAQNIIRSSMTTFVERIKPKFLAEEGVIDEGGKRALRSQEWGEVITIKQGAILTNAIKPAELPTMPPEAFSLDDKDDQDGADGIGMNELLGGQLPVGRKTATAMQQLGQATTVRQSEKRNHLERFYKEVADRMLYLMQGFYEKDRITRIVGDMGDELWDWNADDISFESSVTVEVEPKEVLDTDQKREKFLAMLNILGGDPTVNQTELKRYVLRDGLGIPAEIVRTILKTEEQIQQEQQMQFEQEMALKATGPAGAEAGGEGQKLGVNPAMEPGALGGPPQSLTEAAQTGGVASASPAV